MPEDKSDEVFTYPANKQLAYSGLATNSLVFRLDAGTHRVHRFHIMEVNLEQGWLELENTCIELEISADTLITVASNMEIIIGELSGTIARLKQAAANLHQKHWKLVGTYEENVSFCGEYHPAWKLATEIQNTDAPTLEQLKRWKETATHARG